MLPRPGLHEYASVNSYPKIFLVNIQGVPVSLEILIVNFEIDDHSVKLGLLYQNRLISDANLLHSYIH